MTKHKLKNLIKLVVNEAELLAEKLVAKLKQKNLQIIVVESCTGGALVNEITNIIGASEVMKSAFVPYSNDAKIKLGVPRKILDEYGTYSLETAQALAEVGLDWSGNANISIGITGSLSRIDPVNVGSVPGEVFLVIIFNQEKFKYVIVVNQENSRQKEKEEVVKKILENTLRIID